MLNRFQLLFEFELWANRRSLASIEAATERGRAVRLMAHILAAQDAWLTRLRGADSSGIVVWPEWTAERCRNDLERLAGEIDAYLCGLTPAHLEVEIEYSNQTGRTFRNTPLDILTHLGLHSQHHRGQIALQLRELGRQPAVTDFIAFRRER
jgi:uncharacterized damage-inducible protein DinB